MPGGRALARGLARTVLLVMDAADLARREGPFGVLPVAPGQDVTDYIRESRP